MKRAIIIVLCAALFYSSAGRIAALSPAPDAAAAHRTQGGLLDAKQDYAGAIQEYQKALALDSAAHRLDAALDLNSIGEVFYAQNRWLDALGSFQQALALTRGTGGKAEAVAWNDFGMTANNLGQREDGLAALRRALEIFEKLGDRSEEANTTGNMGTVLLAMRRTEEAAKAWMRSLAIVHVLPASAAEGTQARDYAKTFYDAKQYALAATFYNRQLTCRLAAGDSAGAAAALANLGACADNLNQFPQAADDYTQAISLRQAGDESEFDRDLVERLAVSLRRAERYEDSQAALTRALGSFPRLDDQNKLQIALADLHFFWARALAKQGKTTDAAAHYQAAAAIDRSRRPKDAGYDLHNLGNALHTLGRDGEAVRAFRESLAIGRELAETDRNAGDEAASLEGIITVSLAMNQYDAASDAYEQLRAVKPDALPEYEAMLLNAQADLAEPNGRSAAARAAKFNAQGVKDFAAKRYEKAVPRFRLAMNLRPSSEAYTLNLARALNRAKRYGETVSLLGPKLSAFPEPGDRKELLSEWADAQGGVAQMLDTRKRWTDARAHYLAAFAVDRILRPMLSATELYSAAEDDRNLRRFAEAERGFRQSAQIAHQTESPNREAYSLTELGGVFSDREQYAAAIDIYQQALAISRAQKLRLNEALVLQGLGDCANSLSRYPEALEWRRLSLAVFQELGDRSSAATLMNDLGLTYDNISRPADAQRFYAQALAIHLALHESVKVATVWGNMAAAYYRQGQYAEAIKFYRLALAVPGRDGKALEQPEFLGSMGVVFNDMGRHQDAIQLARRALAIQLRRGYLSGQATCLNNLGTAYFTLGEYGRAVDYFRKAFAANRACGNREGQATDLNNLGFLYDELGQLARASDFYAQALPIRRAIGDRGGEANTLTNQAGIFSEEGSSDASYYDKAALLCEQALTIYREISDADGEGQSLNNLGVLSHSRRRPDEARKYFEQALAARRRVGNRDGESVVLSNLAWLSDTQHQPAPAARYYAQSLTIGLETGDQGHLQATWAALMNLAAANGDPAWAIYCGKESVNILQSLRGNLKSFDKGVQKNYLTLHSATYRALAELLIKQGRLDEAKQVLGMLKEEEFFDFLGRDPAAARALTGSVILTPFESDWQTHLQTSPDRLAFFADAARAFQTAPSTQAAASTHVTLAANTAAVYTIVEPTKLFLIVTTPGGQVAHEVPIPSSKLYRKVLALRAALQDPTHDPRPLSQELYKIVIGPIEGDLARAHATTVLWSLDDALRYLPISALHDGKRYLVERYQNCVLTLAGRTNPSTAPSLSPWTGLGLGVSREHPGFDALPGVRAELDGIFGPIVPGQTLLDSQFTQTTLLAGLRRRNHPLVHIASHFSLSGRDTDSFLLLGDGGHLSMAELKSDPNVFAGVDLLTLSACNTAMEVRSAGGKEVEGFGALAQRLGARSVLASLWPVADASTPVLMREFYRLRRAHPKLSKASDLRQAQIELLRGQAIPTSAPSTTSRAQRAKVAGAVNASLPLFVIDPKAPYAHPFYWAPFILIGNPK